MTTAVEATPIASLFVPMVPAPKPAPGGWGSSAELARERWRRWVWTVATFRDYRKVTAIDRPCRVVATVRIPANVARPALQRPPLAPWRDAVAAAVRRTLLAPGGVLVAAEARYEPLLGVPLLEQPARTGTMIEFFEEGEDR